MTDKYVLDADGKPVQCADLKAWINWFEQPDNRVVAKDEVGDVSVSTVFLSFDHSFTGGPPVLWETMIFGGEHDGYQERYSSKADAVAGHATALAMVQG